MDQDPSTLDESLAANVRAPYLLTAALVPAMIAKGSGSIVKVSTMAARIGLPGLSVYSATKAALESLTRTWAAEFSPAGVRVNTVAPGPTRTDMVLANMGEENAEQFAKTTLLGRLAADAGRTAVYPAAAHPHACGTPAKESAGMSHDRSRRTASPTSFRGARFGVRASERQLSVPAGHRPRLSCRQ